MQSLGTPRYAAPPCLPSAAAVGTPPTPGAAAAARLSLATTLTSSSPLVAQRCCAITPPVTPLVTPLVTPHPRAPATGTSPGLACGLRPDNGSSTCASGAVAAGCLRPGSHRPRSRCYLYCTGTSPRALRGRTATAARPPGDAGYKNPANPALEGCSTRPSRRPAWAGREQRISWTLGP